MSTQHQRISRPQPFSWISHQKHPRRFVVQNPNLRSPSVMIPRPLSSTSRTSSSEILAALTGLAKMKGTSGSIMSRDWMTFSISSGRCIGQNKLPILIYTAEFGPYRFRASSRKDKIRESSGSGWPTRFRSVLSQTASCNCGLSRYQ